MAPTVLSLCSGYGGLELAVRSVYPDSRVVCYCEWEAFSAAILLARMADATLEPAPIWCGDLAELPAAPFLGVDLVTAGFPCQPWSSAGRGLGTADERWIWDDIAALLRQVRPGAVFLENVPPLVSRGGLGYVLADLAALGFDAEWTVLRASDVGAPHRRERVFILADSDSERRAQLRSRCLFDGEWQAHWYDPDGRCGTELVDADEPGRQGDRPPQSNRGRVIASADPFPPGPDDRDAWEFIPPGAQPSFRRDADGASDWLGTAHASFDDQLRTLGNGVVWQQAAAALRLLRKRMHR